MNAQILSSSLRETRFVTATSRSSLLLVSGVTDPTASARVRPIPRAKTGLRLSAALATYCSAISVLLAVGNVGHWWPLWLSVAISSGGIALSNALRLNRAT